MNTHCVCTVLQTVSFLTSTLNKVQHSLNVFPLWKDRSVFRPLFIGRAASPLPLSGKNPLIALGFASDRLFCLCRERFCRIFVQSIPAGVQLRPFVRGFDKEFADVPWLFLVPWLFFSFRDWLVTNNLLSSDGTKTNPAGSEGYAPRPNSYLWRHFESFDGLRPCHS